MLVKAWRAGGRKKERGRGREKEGGKKREGEGEGEKEEGGMVGGRDGGRTEERRCGEKKTTYHCSINDVFDFLFVGRIFQDDCQKPSPTSTSKTTA